MAARAHASAASVAAAPSKVPAQLPGLPEAAVACILQHVPLRQRLTCCALVSRTWAAAAAAAPADVDIQLQNSGHCQQLQHWLAKHGAVVVGLRALGLSYCRDWPTLQLPVQQLTRLRTLELNWCLAFELPAGVTTHSSTSGVRGASLTGTSSSSSNTAGNVDRAVLPQLEELTLWGCELTVQLLSQLLSATALRSLYWIQARVSHELLPDSNDTQTRQLKQERTYAVLWERLQLLPRLSELSLHVGSLTAADIAPLSNLQHLQLLHLQLSEGWLSRDDSGPSKLLSALQHLTQLQHLSLHRMKLHRVSEQPQQQGPSYQCFSALTASTQLTALHLDGGVFAPVPQAAFQHMFPPGRILPHLKVLHLVGDRYSCCVGAAQVAMIAASCPALQEVTLAHVTSDGFDVSCLAQLPSAVTRVQGLCWTRPVP